MSAGFEADRMNTPGRKAAMDRAKKRAVPADRTLAERARELADNYMNLHLGERHPETAELLRALADENDTLTTRIAAWENAADDLVPESLALAERDRYWNLAVQLAEALRSQMTEVGPSVTDMFEAAAALDAFQAERKSRDV